MSPGGYLQSRNSKHLNNNQDTGTVITSNPNKSEKDEKIPNKNMLKS